MQGPSRPCAYGVARMPAEKFSIEIDSFKPQRSNTLFGFCTLNIPALHLRIFDCTVHQKNGARWIGLPAKPQITRTASVRKDERGKTAYSPCSNSATPAHGTRSASARSQRCSNGTRTRSTARWWRDGFAPKAHQRPPLRRYDPILKGSPMIDAVMQLRLRLRACGYLPIPLFGKTPAPKEWQKVATVSPAMIEMWSKSWPTASNTGVLTRLTPTLDVDLLHEPAAVAVEEFVRDAFGERGFVLVRIGKPPKRAIPFRTSKPFKKITAPSDRAQWR